jgi:LPS sulfotransferase NodH
MPRFVIFAQGRSGSTLLTEILDSSPYVRCEGEVLAVPVKNVNRHLHYRRLRQLGRAYGYKVKIYQLAEHHGITDASAWLQEQHDAGWQIIALRRQNLVRQVLSNMAANRSGLYQQWGEGTGPAVRRRPLLVDPAALLYAVRQRSEQGRLEQAALAHVPHISLSYERDLLTPQAQQETLTRLLTHLDLPPARVQTTLQRLTSGSVRDLLANPDQIYGALQGTGYLDMWD